MMCCQNSRDKISIYSRVHHVSSRITSIKQPFKMTEESLMISNADMFLSISLLKKCDHWLLLTHTNQNTNCNSWYVFPDARLSLFFVRGWAKRRPDCSQQHGREEHRERKSCWTEWLLSDMECNHWWRKYCMSQACRNNHILQDNITLVSRCNWHTLQSHQRRVEDESQSKCDSIFTSQKEENDDEKAVIDNM